MKKLLTSFIALTVAVLMSVTVFAVDEPTSMEWIFATVYDAAGENANSSRQTDANGGTSAIGLKPLDGATGEGAWFDYSLTIPADCVRVDFDISYAASGDRYMEFTFDGETRRVTCTDTGAWSSFSVVTETFESVKKGDYVVRVAAPADFDGDAVKTPNFDIIEVGFYYESYESKPETAAPETEPVTTAAPETSAPETTPSDVGGTVAAEGTQNNAQPSDAKTEPGSESKGCGSSVAGVYAVMACAAAGTLFRKRK